jgi:hypothetical protein
MFLPDLARVASDLRKHAGEMVATADAIEQGRMDNVSGELLARALTLNGGYPPDWGAVFGMLPGSMRLLAKVLAAAAVHYDGVVLHSLHWRPTTAAGEVALAEFFLHQVHSIAGTVEQLYAETQGWRRGHALFGYLLKRLKSKPASNRAEIPEDVAYEVWRLWRPELIVDGPSLSAKLQLPLLSASARANLLSMRASKLLLSMSARAQSLQVGADVLEGINIAAGMFNYELLLGEDSRQRIHGLKSTGLLGGAGKPVENAYLLDEPAELHLTADSPTLAHLVQLGGLMSLPH